ncbi:NEL-type E3 ubiquitin ligase domain-containing protein [Providencia sneebia]|uniref:RING-type E3 ubiquitin transferase n=1 Tax=Providencia sneebia DSM 19967 TaxID=1141660 RepID=K8WYE3_9GAMM|nr:NEL-type E3 ubiquitin ligase domain-containing protein [Providencia sneebia]EKT61245.1 hypothetical protein OO7_01031 [Providencia sneebia DSM 19967]
MPNHININMPIASTSTAQHEQTHCDTRALVGNIRAVRESNEDINKKAGLFPCPSTEVKSKEINQKEYLEDWNQWLKNSPDEEKYSRSIALSKLKKCIFHNECTLDLSRLSLTSLPKLPPCIKTLSCERNRLNELPDLPKGLKYLICHSNNISVLPELPERLESLFCNNNQIRTLPKLPKYLDRLICTKNHIITLPKLPDTLTELRCDNNNLNVIPQLPNTLEILDCADNRLSMLPKLPDKLYSVNCSDNNINELPKLPDNLKYFLCSRNNITSLPNLPHGLFFLHCSSNHINMLPNLPHGLINLQCSSNRINMLPYLPSSLKHCNFDNNPISSFSPDIITTVINEEERERMGGRITESLRLDIVSFDNHLLSDEMIGTLFPSIFDANNLEGELHLLINGLTSNLNISMSRQKQNEFIKSIMHWFPNEQKQDIENRFLAFTLEKNAQEFGKFMSKLGLNCNTEKDPAFKEHIAQWLLRLSDSPELRKKTFLAAYDATETCEDRVTLSLNAMMQYELIHNIDRGNYDNNLPDLMAQCREIFRLQYLEKIAADKIVSLRNNLNGRTVDDIEVYLAYQTTLREPLELTTTAQNMRFYTISHIQDHDLKEAELRVKQAENNQFVSWLSQWAPWQALLQRVEPARWEAACADRGERYDKEYKDRVAEQSKAIGMVDEDVTRAVGLQVMNEVNQTVFEPLTVNFCESKGFSELLLAPWEL